VKYHSIVKKRFIDQFSNYKMFGSYILPQRPNDKFSDIFKNSTNLSSSTVLKPNSFFILFIEERRKK
jgi:hypothetical protein